MLSNLAIHFYTSFLHLNLFITFELGPEFDSKRKELIRENKCTIFMGL